ncbi:hypothetical protein AOLI_G00113090 [Acnodon oligacanthus]
MTSEDTWHEVLNKSASKMTVLKRERTLVRGPVGKASSVKGYSLPLLSKRRDLHKNPLSRSLLKVLPTREDS